MWNNTADADMPQMTV